MHLLRRFPTESKVVFALILFLLSLEVFSSILETRLSKDVRYLRSLPLEAAKLANPQDGSMRVLIIGNSLARTAIDSQLLSDLWQKESGRHLQIATFYPDASRIEKWHYGFRRYFAALETSPDLILLCTGRLHLTDSAPSSTEMGAFFVGDADWLSYAAHHIHSVDDGVAFLAGRFSKILAHRHRVRPLLFYNLVPGYATTAALLNTGSSPDSGDSPTQFTSSSFADFIQTTQNQGTDLIVVTMPFPAKYELPACISATIEECGVNFIDAAALVSLPDRHFPDGYHVDRDGAKIFTQILFGRLKHHHATELGKDAPNERQTDSTESH